MYCDLNVVRTVDYNFSAVFPNFLSGQTLRRTRIGKAKKRKWSNNPRGIYQDKIRAGGHVLDFELAITISRR